MLKNGDTGARHPRPSVWTPSGRWHWRLGASREELSLHQDFKDLLSAFASEQVSYLLIGGYAVSYHDRPRYTKDLDLWIDSSHENLRKVYRALASFGAPSRVLRDLEQIKPDEVLWMGNPPVRVDILQTVAGVEYRAAYQRRSEVEWHGVPVSIIGRADLIASKKAAGRPQDMLDAENLETPTNDDF